MRNCIKNSYRLSSERERETIDSGAIGESERPASGDGVFVKINEWTIEVDLFEGDVII